MKCEKCNIECEIYPGSEPWSDKHWVCPKCDSAYCIDESNKIQKKQTYQRLLQNMD